MIIEPERFAAAMEDRWKTDLDNHPSEALRKSWQWIADVFKRHIEDHEDPQNSGRWYILSCPTGAGKTQSCILYAAMLAEAEPCDHPGMLLVTRRILDAETIVADINSTSSRMGLPATAVAYHQGNKQIRPSLTSLEDLKDYPVLVITHEAYLRALEADSGVKLRHYLSYAPGLGERKLRIVDECLDIVSSFSAGLDGLRNTLGVIPQRVRDQFPEQIEAIESTVRVLENHHKTANSSANVVNYAIPEVDFTPLKDALYKSGLVVDEIHDQRLKALSQILKSWRYCQNGLTDTAIHTATLALPEGHPRGNVVMDATASINTSYALRPDVVFEEPPANTRSYQNVTIYASTGHRVGKNAFLETMNQTIPAVLDSLKDRLRGRKVLFICPQAGEDCANAVLTEKARGFHWAVAHWGAIEGSNQFMRFDTAVILSLPYLPDHVSINTFFALQGPQGDDWLNDPAKRAWGDYPDIKASLRTGKVSSDLVQAINRIRCRKTCDPMGNCPPAEVYLMLGVNHAETSQIVSDIRKTMPGVVMDFESWKPKVVKSKMGRSVKWTPEVIIKAVQENYEKTKQTKVHRKHLENIKRINERTMDGLIRQLKDPSSEYHKKAQAAGVGVLVEKWGRNYKTFFTFQPS